MSVSSALIENIKNPYKASPVVWNNVQQLVLDSSKYEARIEGGYWLYIHFQLQNVVSEKDKESSRIIYYNDNKEEYNFQDAMEYCVTEILKQFKGTIAYSKNVNIYVTVPPRQRDEHGNIQAHMYDGNVDIYRTNAEIIATSMFMKYLRDFHPDHKWNPEKMPNFLCNINHFVSWESVSILFGCEAKDQFMGKDPDRIGFNQDCDNKEEMEVEYSRTPQGNTLRIVKYIREDEQPADQENYGLLYIKMILSPEEYDFNAKEFTNPKEADKPG